jgi:polyhydroxybutyrate depolymerase
MMLQTLLLLAIVAAAEPSTEPHAVRTVFVGGINRSYLLHLPPDYDPQTPTPVVLVFHGAAANGYFISDFSGMNKKADEPGFVAVYPNGKRLSNTLLTWNSGGLSRKDHPDDVEFVKRLLDNLAQVVNVDPKRVYATGHSNGAMMCYRLAVELSDRIAAIAPVGGTMGVDLPGSQRPMSVIHFHGTHDEMVPWNGPTQEMLQELRFTSVERTIQAWAKANNCPERPGVTAMPNTALDGTKVVRIEYESGDDNTRVVLYMIKGGGHTWPGMERSGDRYGRSTLDISANDLMWTFFKMHPMK